MASSSISTITTQQLSLVLVSNLLKPTGTRERDGGNKQNECIIGSARLQKESESDRCINYLFQQRRISCCAALRLESSHLRAGYIAVDIDRVYSQTILCAIADKK